MNMKRLLLTFAALASLCFTSYAFKEKEITVRSECMDKDIYVTVITPDGYRKGKAFPVVYLIHCLLPRKSNGIFLSPRNWLY